MIRGEMFIVSAPSGTGKSTLIRRLVETGLAPYGDIVHSVSHTTRPPRPGEKDGHEYHFVDLERFEAMVSDERFLEWADYNGHRYGTSKEEVLPRLERGVDVILDIEVKGAEQLLTRHPEAHGIFVLPPTFADLERRLRRRGHDRDPEIARRLAVSLWETKRYDRYEYIIINDDLDRASQVLAAIILEKRHRLDRIRPRVREVLRSFEDAVPEEARRSQEGGDGG